MAWPTAEARREYERAQYAKHGDRRRAAAREYYKTHKDAHRQASWKYDIKMNYGITVEEYERLLAYQGGGCAICGQPHDVGKKLHVDHDHVTMKVRGLLCSACNSLLGYARDSTDTLKRAMQYLEEEAK